MYQNWYVVGQSSTAPLHSRSGASIFAKIAGDNTTRFRCECAATSQSIADDIVVVVIGRMDELHSLRTALHLETGADLSASVREAYRKWGPHEFAGHLFGDFLSCFGMVQRSA